MNHFTHKLLLLILLGSMTSCSTFSAESLSNSSSTDIMVDHGKIVSIVPFENPGIIVKATINHEKECRFLVDTGAVVVIDSKIAALINHQKIGQVVAKDATNSKKNVERIVVDSIKIGDTEVAYCKALVTDLHKMGIDGIIGGDFLKFFKIKIDYSQKQITFSNQINQTEKAESGYKVNLKKDFMNRIYADLTIDNTQDSIPALIDTGALLNNYILFPIKYLDKFKPILACKPIIQNDLNPWLYGSASGSVCSRFTGVQLGNFHQKNLPVRFVDIQEAIITNKFLSYFTVIINYPMGEMTLTPYPDKQMENNILSLGFTPIFDENQKLKVIAVEKDSLAAKEGLQINDEIVQAYVDGKPLLLENKLNFKDFEMNDKKNRILRLIVRNANGDREIILKPVPLLPEI